jgi:hypothetical protein
LVDIDGEGKRRLKVIGSQPPAFRKIDVDKDPTLSVNGFITELMWLPEAGGAFVSMPGRTQVVRFDDLEFGTEVEVLLYAK